MTKPTIALTAGGLALLQPWMPGSPGESYAYPLVQVRAVADQPAVLTPIAVEEQETGNHGRQTTGEDWPCCPGEGGPEQFEIS